MASNPAVDEFESLVSRNSKASRASHPEDDSDLVSDSTTLAPSIRSSKPSLRSSHLSASSRKQRPLSTASEASFYNHDSSDSDGENVTPITRKPTKYYLPNSYDKDAMTGPKGVIADAQAFEREKSGKRSSDYKRTIQLALPRSQSYGGASGPSSRKGSASEEADGKSDGKSDGSSDEEAVRQWRERRLDEMRGKVERRGGFMRRDPHHGTLENVSADRFLEAIETAGRGAVVVVYIFDDSKPVSDAYAPHIAALAAKHPHVHFLALHHLDAGIESAGVPALLAYRNGDKFADLLPLESEVPYAKHVLSRLEDAMVKREML